MKVRSCLFALVVAGCGQSTTLPPSTPPGPWGVPISGGTMLVTRDGAHAVIADPDRDRVLFVELSDDQVTAEVPLQKHDEPGRLVEDGAGRIHVALRRGGAVVTLSSAGTLIERQSVCPEPRGLAWDSTNDLIDVACTGGALVSLPAAGGAAVRTVQLDRDLRDVVFSGGQLYVTRFRTAELLSVDATGAITNRVTPPDVQRFDTSGGITDPGVPPPDGGVSGGSGAGSGEPGMIPAIAAVAWRTIAMPDGRLVMVHQRQLQTILHTTQPGGYGAGCSGNGPDEDAITVVTPGQAPVATAAELSGALPVDVAVSPSGNTLAIATAGDHLVEEVSTCVLTIAYLDGCGPPPPRGVGGMGLGGGVAPPPNPGGPALGPLPTVVPIGDLGAPTSVAFAPSGNLLVYYPELPALAIVDTTGNVKTVTLPGEFGYDAGRALFHQQSPSGLACASCHPEGRDDGLIWQFAEEGARRTQSLAGSILSRAPYHWQGTESSLPALMDDVFGNRMGGGTLTNSQHVSLGPWLDRVPAPAPPQVADAAAVARGEALFQSPDVGCTQCHNGPLFTNHQVVDVGTGGKFKVPSLLGVGARPPYLHDGCAPTLFDRFGSCGGGDMHGHTSQLTQAQIADLVAYLSSL